MSRSNRRQIEIAIIKIARDIASRPKNERVHELAEQLVTHLGNLDVEIMVEELGINDFEDQP